MKTPCFNCPQRSTSCHDTCERYQIYKNHRQGISDARVKQNFLQDYFRDAINRSEKQRRLHA